jgi:hypothetical protein
MTPTEDKILELINELIIKHTGNPINDLQRDTILGIWEHKTYGEIANGLNYDDEYIGKISSEIYKILSQELKNLGQQGEVNKHNFCWSLERLANLYNPNFLHYSHIIYNGHVNFCSNTPHTDTEDLSNENSAPKIYHDLTQAPRKITKFYNRTSELEILRDLVLNKNIPLISVLGLSGIGKTTLVRQFVDLNLDKFEVIIWKNLKLSNSLETIITDIFAKINTDFILGNEDNITRFLNLLQTKKCLIIFANVEELFIRGELGGKYQTKHKEYENLFSLITTEVEQKSSLILISQEQCVQMLNDYSEEIELRGLNTIECLKILGLKEENSWLELINLYDGNLVYLKHIAYIIKKNYGGKVSEFLAENSLLTSEIESHCEELFQRLSPLEQKILLAISLSTSELRNQPVSRQDLREKLDLLPVDFRNGLLSLQQRYLVKTRVENEQTWFDLTPVFQEYLSNYQSS